MEDITGGKHRMEEEKEGEDSDTQRYEACSGGSCFHDHVELQAGRSECSPDHALRLLAMGLNGVDPVTR